MTRIGMFWRRRPAALRPSDAQALGLLLLASIVAGFLMAPTLFGVMK